MRLIDLDHTATAHHGLVTRATSELSRSAWYRAVSAGTLDQLHPGVARLPGTLRTYRQRVAAAVLAVHVPDTRAGGASTAVTERGTDVVAALASHRSAAALWLGWSDELIERHFSPQPDHTVGNDDQADTSRPDPPAAIDLIVVGRQQVRSLDGVTLHRTTDGRRLAPARVDEIRCTNILRTLIDLGAVHPSTVSTLLGHALSTRLATLDAVETTLHEHARRGRSGTRALRQAIDEWAIDAKPADSVLEIAFCRLVRQFDLPPVEFHPIVERWEVDFRFVGTRVLVECDGWTTHGLDRRQFERDRRRDVELAAAGWIVSRHSYRAITREAGATARRLTRLLAHSEAS